jgi:hypothetical protein
VATADYFVPNVSPMTNRRKPMNSPSNYIAACRSRRAAYLKHSVCAPFRRYFQSVSAVICSHIRQSAVDSWWPHCGSGCALCSVNRCDGISRRTVYARVRRGTDAIWNPWVAVLPNAPYPSPIQSNASGRTPWRPCACRTSVANMGSTSRTLPDRNNECYPSRISTAS